MTEEPEEPHARRSRKRRGVRSRRVHPVVDEVFDLSGSDPELLSSGRIPDPQPEHTPLFRWLAGVLGALEEFLRARGGAPLRVGIRIFWGVIAAVGVFLLVGPIINKPLDFDDVLASAEIEDVDWIARDAAVDYTVSRGDDGSFEATVREEFGANFVNGRESSVVRRVVTEVNGHDTEFVLHSALIDGEPARVVTKRHPTNTDIVLTRADGEPLSGEQQVTVEYELHHLATPELDEATGSPVDAWSWPLFAPTWPQATKGIEVSVTFSKELDEALVRSPRATVGWLLLSSTVWLTPEGETADGVRYAFENDDSLPPNSDVWVFASFEEGTFSQPPETTLFWVQTYGPLIPLALLAITALCGFVARRVVWADSAGAPWFVARSEPPKGIDPELAVQLLDRPRHAELVSVLARAPKSPWAAKLKERRRSGGSRELVQRQRHRSDWLFDVAHAGSRAGLAGNLPSVFRWARRWNTSRELEERGLRWIPDGYVRDSLVAAPIALTLLQWGLLRQLSHQVILLIVWWPAVFVLVSTVLAIVTLWAVNRPRPLTREGALAVQELKGVGVYARSTRLVERGPLDDPLLPYAVPFVPPRQAGGAVTQLAIEESGMRTLANGWRSKHFLSMPAMLGFVASIAVLAGSIFVVATTPAPYAQEQYQTWPSSPFAGDIWNQVEGFDIEATVKKGADGVATLTAVERHQVRFTPGGGSVPQFSREWQSARAGQELGLSVESVWLDGAEVPFRTVEQPYTTALVTQMTEVVSDLHEVEIRYTLADPVVELGAGGGKQQQLRWAALIGNWDDTFYIDPTSFGRGSSPVRPLRVQVTLAPEVAAELESGGWIDYSATAPDLPFERGGGEKPWVYEVRTYLDSDDPNIELGVPYDLVVGSKQMRGDGSLIVTLDADGVRSRERDRVDDAPVTGFTVDPEVNDTLGAHELDISRDLGVVLNFAPGTFENVSDGAYSAFRVARAAPLVLLSVFTSLIIVGAAVMSVALFGRRGRLGTSGKLTSFGTVTLLAAAQSVVYWWVVGPSTSNSIAISQSILGVVMWAAVVTQWVAATDSQVRDDTTNTKD